MDTTNKVKWYFRPSWIILAILAVGPFAIPLVWKSPVLKRSHKTLIIIGLIIMTIWLIKASTVLYQTLLNNMAELQKAM